MLLSAWYVATNGLNTNAGNSLSAPFQTIQKAATAAQPGDTVYIRAGTYRETVTPTNSGTSGSPITYMPYNAEKVVISGADVVGGWSLSNGSIYQANMNWSLGDGDQVFVDGQMMNYARWPNTSLDVSRPTKILADSGSYTTNPTIGTYTATALNAFPDNYWQDATIHFEAGSQWLQQTGTVTSSSKAQGSVTFSFTLIASDPAYYLKAGNPFYLTGKFNALDTAGEWFLDATASKLYLWTPQGDNPATSHVVEAKHRINAFDLSGKSYTDIQGLSLFASTITTNNTSSYDIIDGIQASYVSQYDQAATGVWGLHMEDTGILIMGSYNTLKNSEIAFSAGNGVTVMGSNQLIDNNLIHDVDYAATDNAAINTGNGGGGPPATSTYNTISNNTVYNSGRSLILFRNLQYGNIVHNDVYDAALQTYDTGALYSYYQNGQGTVIAYNRVHDTSETGIYLDNYSSNYIVHHNLIYNSGTALILNAPSTSNLIYNNTLVSGSSVNGSGDMTGTALKNNIYTGSVVLGTNYSSSNNLFSDTDPQFVAPTSLNFQIASGSPAKDQGAVLPPYTDGYVGSAPDIGAFEYGLSAWTAGAASSFLNSIPVGSTNLATSSSDPMQVNLTWQDNASNETSYVVERSTDGRNYVPIVRLLPGVTSYVDAAMIPNTYYYRVRVDNQLYNSAYSNQVSINTGQAAVNTILAGSFYSTGGTRGGVIKAGNSIGGCDVGDWVRYTNVYFTPGVNSISALYNSPYAAGNNIEFRQDSATGAIIGSITTVLTTTNVTGSASVSSAATGLHDVYITFSGTGNGGWGVCNLSSFQFGDSTSVAAPSGVTAAAASITTINMNWTDNSTNEAGFKIERSTDNQTFIQIGAVAANITTFQDTRPSQGTLYYYRLLAFDANYGNSSPSNVANTSAISPALTTIQAESFFAGDTGSNGGVNSGGVIKAGSVIGGCDNGDWVRYRNQDFGPAGADTVDVRYYSNYNNSTLQFRLGSPTGQLIGSLTTNATTQWTTGTVSLSYIPTGIQDVYMTISGTGGNGWGLYSLDWFRFSRTALTTVQAESFIDGDTGSNGGVNSGGVIKAGSVIGGCDNGDWVRYRNMNFGAGANTVDVRYYSNYNNSTLQFHLGSPTGQLIGSLTTNATTQWTTGTVSLSYIPTGIQDVYMTISGTGGNGWGLYSLDWFKFYNV